MMFLSCLCCGAVQPGPCYPDCAIARQAEREAERERALTRRVADGLRRRVVGGEGAPRVYTLTPEGLRRAKDETRRFFDPTHAPGKQGAA